MAEAHTNEGLARHEQHHHSDRGEAGQGNLTGSSTQGGVTSTDGSHLTTNKENHAQSASRDAGKEDHVKDVVEGVAGDGKNELSHRENEDASLPKALTEKVSKAVPHSKVEE